MVVLGPAQGLDPGMGDVIAVTQRVEQADHDQHIRLVIVDDKHVPVLARRAVVVEVAGIARRAFQRQTHAEGRTEPQGRGCRYVAGHAFGQSLADRQAKPRPAIFARHRTVGLGKLLEHRLDLVGRDADAGVGNVDDDGTTGDGVDRPHDDADRALLGELDRITNQVVEYLLDAERVAEIEIAELGIVIEAQLQALFAGAHLHQFDNIGHDLDQVEFDGFDVDDALVDLGEVEQIIDQGQQPVGALPQHGDALLVARAQDVGQAENMRQADNGVHRGAQFVAHIGHEFVAAAIGLENQLFGALALGNVARHLGNADYLALGIADRRYGQRDVNQPAVARPAHGLEMVDRHAAAHLGKDFVLLFHLVRRHDQPDVLADGFFGRIAEQPGGGAVPRGDDPVEVLADDDIVRRIDDSGEVRPHFCGIFAEWAIHGFIREFIWG